jgi:RNA methyltransferase, TrmH family
MILAVSPTARHSRMGGEARSGGALRRIEGRHNALVKELRKAFAKGDVTEKSLCAIEGWRILEEAIRSGVKFHAVFFSASAQDRAERFLPQLGAHVEKLMLPDSLFASAVATDTPQGVAALVHWREFTLGDLLVRSESRPLLVIAGVQDPGNLGTILRSAEAFEVAGALLGEGTVSPFNWKVVRASAGSLFRLPVVRMPVPQALNQVRRRGLRLIATSSHKGTALDEAKLNGPLAIFIGSEGAGLSRDLLKEMDEIVAIPHSPKVESLNAGVATSIVLYEIARQRGGSTTEAGSHGRT